MMGEQRAELRIGDRVMYIGPRIVARCRPGSIGEVVGLPAPESGKGVLVDWGWKGWWDFPTQQLCRLNPLGDGVWVSFEELGLSFDELRSLAARYHREVGGSR